MIFCALARLAAVVALAAVAPLLTVVAVEVEDETAEVAMVIIDQSYVGTDWQYLRPQFK